MKLIIGIVSSDDTSPVLSALTKAGFSATKLSTSGGFLRAGNTTLLVGTEDERVKDVLSVFENESSKRTELAPSTPPFAGEGFMSSTPIPVTAGGATVFVLAVDQFFKY